MKKNKLQVENGLHLIALFNIVDYKTSNRVKSVDYEFLKFMGEEDVSKKCIIDTCKELGLQEVDRRIYMIIEIENGRAMRCDSVVFIDEDGIFVDGCESDFRVYASVAFKESGLY